MIDFHKTRPDASVYKPEVFEYLDDLRESGRVNMFGAAEYIEGVFYVSRQEARDLLKEWMQTFEARHAEKQV